MIVSFHELAEGELIDRSRDGSIGDRSAYFLSAQMRPLQAGATQAP
jgi:hypothetical protein